MDGWMDSIGTYSYTILYEGAEFDTHLEIAGCLRLATV